MKELPKTLTIKEHILPFAKELMDKEGDITIDVENSFTWLTARLCEAKFGFVEADSWWGHVDDIEGDSVSVEIESSYQDAFRGRAPIMPLSTIIRTLEEHLETNS